MNDHDRDLLIAKLHVVLQLALVEIRNLALSKAHQQIHDLADAVEFLPALVLRWDTEPVNLVRPALEQYESKYPDSSCRYTGILDMDETQFNQLYRPTHYDWDIDSTQDTFTGEQVTSE
jgi:hypothetical protein